MTDADSYNQAAEDLESRITLIDCKFKCIDLEGFTFESMANTHKPVLPPRQEVDENIDYGARRTVDPRGVCHAERDAEKYFTFGKNERVPGFSRRANRPDYEAYIDPETEAGCEAGSTAEPNAQRQDGLFPPDPKQYKDQVLAAARNATVEGTIKKQPGRFKIKVLGLPAQANSFILFRRKNFSDWIKYGDPSPILLAEVLYVNDKYEDIMSWQPVGPNAIKGPWRYYVSRWDLHQRTMNKTNSNFILYKAHSRFHPAIIDKEKSTNVSTWFMTKTEMDGLGKAAAKRAWCYSRSYIDFNSGDFILLKQMAMFTSPLENLFASDLKSLIKSDKEFREWYSDRLLPPGASSSSKGSSSSSASAAPAGDDGNLPSDADRSSSDRNQALHLCLVEAVQKEFEQDEGGRFSENEEVEDWRFIQHARNFSGDPYEASSSVLALLDRTAPDVAASDDDDASRSHGNSSSSSSSSSSCAGAASANTKGRHIPPSNGIPSSASEADSENSSVANRKKGKVGRPKKKF